MCVHTTPSALAPPPLYPFPCSPLPPCLFPPPKVSCARHRFEANVRNGAGTLWVFVLAWTFGTPVLQAIRGNGILSARECKSVTTIGGKRYFLSRVRTIFKLRLIELASVALWLPCTSSFPRCPCLERRWVRCLIWTVRLVRSWKTVIPVRISLWYGMMGMFSLKETDPKEQVNPDWIEMGQSEDVLSKADKIPEHLQAVKEEEVRITQFALKATKCTRLSQQIRGLSWLELLCLHSERSAPCTHRLQTARTKSLSVLVIAQNSVKCR